MPTEASASGAPAPQTVMEHAACVMEILRDYDQIVVSGHVNPDGDAIGSSSALVWLLRRMGKQAALINATGVPDYLNWMPLPGVAHRFVSQLPFKPNLLVSLDCGDVWCLGKELSGMLPQLPCVNVDHHQGNPRFGTLYNWIDPRMAATGQMVAALADAVGVPLDGELAACIYVALVTDTGSFTHGNTTAEVYRLAARLMDKGLDAAAIRNQLDNQWSMSKVRLWGRLLQQIRLERSGMVGVCTVALADLAEAGA
ncbi:MAG TPA: DHH family phosphoesterase, partial [Candidatus Avidesulfovibrio excrementigallinarum]|nr:DHH family phosphoesterase [Candidatus Avidesulfovibrio excrementigallinarum]